MNRVKFNVLNTQSKRGMLLILILALLLMLPLVIACEPLEPITVYNGTSETLTIFIEDIIGEALIGNVAPHAEIKNSIVVASPPFEYTITAKDAQGNVIYKEMFKRMELKWMKWRVLIPSSRTPKAR